MDKLVQTSYAFFMLRGLTIIVTAISLAVITLAVQAHGTGMAGMKAYGPLTQHVEHVPSPKTGCVEDGACNADIGLCTFACTGISGWLPLERHSVGQDSKQQKYMLSPDPALLAAVPDLDNRPPISRLL